MIYQTGVLSDERRTVSWLTLQSNSGKKFYNGEVCALRANPECGIFRYFCAEVTVVRNFSVYNTVFLPRVPGVFAEGALLRQTVRSIRLWISAAHLI